MNYTKLPQRIVNGNPGNGVPALSCQISIKGEACARTGSARLNSVRFAANSYVPPGAFSQMDINIPGVQISCNGKAHNIYITIHDRDIHVPWLENPWQPRQVPWRTFETKRPAFPEDGQAPFKFDVKVEMRLWWPGDHLELLHAVLDADFDADIDARYNFCLGGALNYRLTVGYKVGIAILDR